MAVWEAEPDVDIRVLVWPSGPLEEATADPVDVTNYVAGQGIQISRGRSSEFSEFQSGACAFTLKNNAREFDPSLTGVALDLPGAVGATASTPDVSALAPNGDIRVRAKLRLDSWGGGFGQVIISQWGSAGNEGWYFGINNPGNLVFVFTTDGTTDQIRTSTETLGFDAGTTHWVEAVLDVNNGAAGHDVIFNVSVDGTSWTQLGDKVTTAGTVTVFNSTANLEIGAVLPLVGQVYEAEVTIGAATSGSAAWNCQIEAVPGNTIVAPAVTTYTANDLDIYHAMAFLEGTEQTGTWTPPAGCTERLDRITGVGSTLSVSVATRDPATGVAGTFTSSQSNWNVGVGSHVVVRGTAPTAFRSLSEAWVPATVQQIVEVTVDKPAGTVTGDALVAFISLGNTILKRPTAVSAPPGWQHLGNLIVLASGQIGIAATWFKTATSVEPDDYTFSINAGTSLGTKTALGTIVAVQSPDLQAVGATVRAAAPNFTLEDPGVTSFTDEVGRVWTVNGTAAIGYDDDASPFAPILKTGRRLQVVATYQGVDYTLFTGYIDGWPQAWTSTTGTVDVTAHDLLSVLATDDVASSPTQFILGDPVQGVLGVGRLGGVLPEQLSGERIAALLSFAGVGVGSTFQLADGLTSVVPIEVEGNLLGLINDVTEAEAGFFYVSKAGEVVFLDRHSRFEDQRLSTTQAVVTDSEYSQMSVDFDKTQVWNHARFIRPAVDGELVAKLGATGGDAGDVPVEEVGGDDPVSQTATDGLSIKVNGRRVHSATVPVASDAEALGRAEFWVRRYKEAKQRPSPVTIRPRRDMPGLFPVAVGRELLDRIELERTPLGISPTQTFTGLVEQIDHVITNDSWETTLGISLIDADEGAGFLRLGHPDTGRLGTGTLAY